MKNREDPECSITVQVSYKGIFVSFLISINVKKKKKKKNSSTTDARSLGFQLMLVIYSLRQASTESVKTSKLSKP